MYGRQKMKAFDNSSLRYVTGCVRRTVGVVFALLLLSAAEVQRSPLSAETIRITNGEWQPFMSEHSYQFGVNSHIVAEAFRMEGIDVEWGFFPWKRSYQIAKTCQSWHASATWWPAQETLESFLLGDAVSETSFVFFHRKDRPFKWQTFDDLYGLVVGTTLEYDYGTDFMSRIENYELNVEWVADDETNFRKLAANRIDVFPNDLTVGLAQIRASLSPDEAGSITYHPKEFEKSTLHLIVSKQCDKAEYFIEKFNAGFKKLKESGRFDAMQKDLANGVYDGKGGPQLN